METSALPIPAEDIQGMKFFGPIFKLLARLHAEKAHNNRKLYYDHYVSLLLLYFFTPTLTTLRDVQRASGLRKVCKKLGVNRASLGSLSEASSVFDPELIKTIFLELAKDAFARDGMPRPKGVPDALALIAADGSLLDALPKMIWAHWVGEHDKAVKIHLQFDVLRGVPMNAELTDGNGDEKTALKEHLEPGNMYIIDRGYFDYSLYNKIIEAKSSFLARLRGNFVSAVLEEFPVSDETRAAGVMSDQKVMIGGQKSDTRIQTPMRLVKVHVKVPPQNGRKPRGPTVSRKVKSVRVQETEFDVWLLTNRMDIPAESLGLIYKYRWQIEFFFRWLKCTLGCRHLLAHSKNGIQIQMYLALIASLLVVLWTNRKPNKISLFYLSMYFQGWADLDEVMDHLKTLKSAK